MKKFYNLPNILTSFRLILIIPILILANMNTRFSSLLAAILFVIAAMTDVLDGYFARKHNLVTTFGKLIDPLADKLLIVSILIILVKLHRVPVIFPLIIIAREFTITGLRAVATTQGIIIQANQLGKDKALFQNVSLTCLLIYYPLWGINSYAVGLFFITIATFYTVFSGIKYIKDFIEKIK